MGRRNRPKLLPVFPVTICTHALHDGTVGVLLALDRPSSRLVGLLYQPRHGSRRGDL